MLLLNFVIKIYAGGKHRGGFWYVKPIFPNIKSNPRAIILEKNWLNIPRVSSKFSRIPGSCSGTLDSFPRSWLSTLCKIPGSRLGTPGNAEENQTKNHEILNCPIEQSV